MRSVALIAAVALMLGCLLPARAENFESFCTVPDLSAPQRQTIVILDEHHVFGETDQQDGRNAIWRRFIGNLLLPGNQATLEQNFQPRERVTILLARKDGAGTRAVFSGCLPFYSAAERTRLASKAGAMGGINRFMGWDDDTSARRAMDMFRIQLGNAFRAALDPASLSHGAAADQRLSASGLASSLKQGALVNFAYGIPRIILFSDLQRFFRTLPGSTEAARQYGQGEGFAADIDFKGAEFYVVGLSGGGPSHEAIAQFLLASHAELDGASSASALPAFQPPPRRVTRYQGQIIYPENRYTIRIRLAVDENGTAVNSWLWVQQSNEQFVPVHGVITCSDNGCVYNGDQTLAQVWNPGRGAGRPPKLDASLPFGGARNLNLKMGGNWLSGSISDPLIRFDGLKSMRLDFSAAVQPSARF